MQLTTNELLFWLTLMGIPGVVILAALYFDYKCRLARIAKGTEE